MNPALFFLFKYLFLPLGSAAVMHIIVHFQLLLLHKVLDFGLTHQRRTRINLAVFFSTFFVVLSLILITDYLKGNLRG